MMNQEVRKIMNANPDIASPDQNVEELSHQMLNNGIQQMPVVEDGKLLGMVTTYDLWKNYEKKTTLGDLKVRCLSGVIYRCLSGAEDNDIKS